MHQSISRRSLLLLTIAVAVATWTGCGPKVTPPPPKAAVKGTITLNGSPMPSGEIVFTMMGQPESRLTVTNGSYTGEALIGVNSVGVFSYIESPPDSGLSTDEVKKTNIVAQRFSYQTQLTADVKAEGNADFNFDVATQ